MVEYVLHLARRIVPQRMRAGLGRLELHNVVWKLPPPLPGLRMKGPGVFGTYVERAYEPEVTRVLMQTVQPGWTCVDVGAHLGYFTLLLARLVGEAGRVFAFEALPENAWWLRENVALNGFTDRVIVEHRAVADGKQPIVHLNALLHYTSEWSIVRPSPVHHSVAVQATSLDEYFAQGPRVDFIKMDIEGAEYMALQGGQGILRHHRPLCLVELHGEEGQMAARFLQEMGYRVEDLEGRPLSGPLFPSHIPAQPGEGS